MTKNFQMRLPTIKAHCNQKAIQAMKVRGCMQVPKRAIPFCVQPVMQATHYRVRALAASNPLPKRSITHMPTFSIPYRTSISRTLLTEMLATVAIRVLRHNVYEVKWVNKAISSAKVVMAICTPSVNMEETAGSMNRTVNPAIKTVTDIPRLLQIPLAVLFEALRTIVLQPMPIPRQAV